MSFHSGPSSPRPGTLHAIAVALAESASVREEDSNNTAAGVILSSPPAAMTSSDEPKAPASPGAVVQHNETDGHSDAVDGTRQGSITIVRDRITPITVLCRTPISDSMRASFKNHAAERTSPTSPFAKSASKGDPQQIERLGRKYPKYARRLLELDIDGDGVLGEDEVEAALHELIKAETQVKLLKWIVLALTVMTVLLIGATFGVSIAAAFIAKDTQMSSSSTMVDKNTGWSVATGPSSMRNMEATDTLEQIAQVQAVASGQRRLLASADLSAAYDPLSSSSNAGDVSDAAFDASGLSLRSQQRRLLQTPSLYGWVNAYGLSDTYAGLQDTWFSSNGLPTHATVLVVSKDTPQSTIDALAANTKYWCPDIKSATPDTTKMEGFFLSIYYCDAVFQAQSTGTAPPTTYSCGCRLAVAKTKCKALSDPQNPMNLTCAQDTTSLNLYKATATCSVRSYNCPSKTSLQQAYQWGTATFGNPGFTLTSGGSMSTTTTTTTSGGSHHRRLMAVAGDGASRATHGRKLTQWDTDPFSITLDRTTSNTQSTSGSAGWGR